MSYTDFEDRVIKAISDGDLDQLKKCCIGKNDVNRKICFGKEVQVKPKSGQYVFQTIRSPTPVIYTILCEQEELLKYILETKKPDLSIRVNGWAPIHYAAITVSHKCLELMLKYAYIQENIDCPVDENIASQGNLGKTTALHIATTNRRHAQAILLTQELPRIEFNEDSTPVSQSPTDEVQLNEPANPNQLSFHGNAPLHIAARQKDWDMCQILLNAYNDTSKTNSQGKTAADIARERKCNELAEKLDKGEIEEINVLKDKYLSEKKIKGKKSEKKTKNNSDEEDEEEEEDEDEMRISRTQFKEMQKSIQKLTHIVQQLNTRVIALEAERNGENRTVVSQYIPTQVSTITQCSRCGTPTNQKCEQCSYFYCQTCWRKPSHPCIVNT